MNNLVEVGEKVKVAMVVPYSVGGIANATEQTIAWNGIHVVVIQSTIVVQLHACTLSTRRLD